MSFDELLAFNHLYHIPVLHSREEGKLLVLGATQFYSLILNLLPNLSYCGIFSKLKVDFQWFLE